MAWVDEDAHDVDHAQVRLLSIPHFWLTGLLMTARSYVFMCAGLVEMAELMCSVWQHQRYSALATDSDTDSASSACVSALLISALATSCSALLCVSAQMHGVSVLASGSIAPS